MTQNTKFDSIDALKESDNTDILLDFDTRSMENFASAKKRQQNSKVSIIFEIQVYRWKRKVLV